MAHICLIILLGLLVILLDDAPRYPGDGERPCHERAENSTLERPVWHAICRLLSTESSCVATWWPLCFRMSLLYLAVVVGEEIRQALRSVMMHYLRFHACLIFKCHILSVFSFFLERFYDSPHDSRRSTHRKLTENLLTITATACRQQERVSIHYFQPASTGVAGRTGTRHEGRTCQVSSTSNLCGGRCPRSTSTIQLLNFEYLQPTNEPTQHATIAAAADTPSSSREVEV